MHVAPGLRSRIGVQHDDLSVGIEPLVDVGLGIQVKPGSIGPYVILREVARGGMGAVHLATHRALDRVCVLKTILPSTEETALVRFRHEAEALHRLRHPNVVQLFDLDLSESPPYIVMEFLDGVALGALIQQARGRVDLPAVLQIVTDTCAGLEAAHALGLLHRDLKPSNLMVLTNGSTKLIDFGLARRAVHTRLTVNQKFVGTLRYLAPERLRGAEATVASDVFAMGVVALEAMTGQRAFRRSPVDELIEAQSQRAYPKPTSHGVPPLVARVVERALSPAPGDRHASAEAFRLDLTSAVESVRLEVSRAAVRSWIDAMTAASEGALETTGQVNADLFEVDATRTDPVARPAEPTRTDVRNAKPKPPRRPAVRRAPPRRRRKVGLYVLIALAMGLLVAMATRVAVREQPRAEPERRPARSPGVIQRPGAAPRAEAERIVRDGGAAPEASGAPQPSRPSDAQLYTAGNRYLLLGELRRAEEALEAAVRANPNHAPSHRSLGVLHARNDDHEKAIEHYERYLQLRPNAKDAEKVRAMVANTRRDLASSREDAKAWERIDASIRKAEDPFQSEQQRLEAALDALRTMRRLCEARLAAGTGERTAVNACIDNGEAFGARGPTVRRCRSLLRRALRK
ncbi:MAG: protein kinase [Deltaproteobacteria bacterium]